MILNWNVLQYVGQRVGLHDQALGEVNGGLLTVCQDDRWSHRAATEMCAYMVRPIAHFGCSYVHTEGLFSLLETAARISPAALASASLPILMVAILVVVLIPDDSSVSVVAWTVVVSTLAATTTGLFVGSIVLEGLQEAD
nr:hypothetical protein CTI12_AA429660 [Tanacetum cinerariifolium]